MVNVYLTDGTIAKIEGSCETSIDEDFLYLQLSSRTIGFSLKFVVFYDHITDDDSADDEDEVGKLTIVPPRAGTQRST